MEIFAYFVGLVFGLIIGYWFAMRRVDAKAANARRTIDGGGPTDPTGPV